MSALKAPIDYKSLEEELHAALAADELYKLQNDAKIRAVEQNVPTYEHFRQMVNGAHLRPLDRSDMKPKIGVQWNPMSSNIRFHRSNVSVTSEKFKNVNESNKNIKKGFPETCKDFLQSWKMIADDYSEKFNYVWNLRNILQTHIFCVEIPMSFFGDFVNVCLQYLSIVDDTTPIIDLLNILSTCNRFSLTICFITKNERFICEQLFQQLQLREKPRNKNTIQSLAAKYGIKFD